MIERGTTILRRLAVSEKKCATQSELRIPRCR